MLQNRVMNLADEKRNNKKRVHIALTQICTPIFKKEGKNVYVIVWSRIFHGDIFGNDLYELYENIRIKRRYSRKII